MDGRKFGWTIALVGAVVLVITSLFPALNMVINTFHKPTPADACPRIAGTQPKGTGCGRLLATQKCNKLLSSSPRFLAYDPRTKPNTFGRPVVQHTPKGATEELLRRIRTDRALTSVIATDFRVVSYGYGGYRQQTRHYMRNRMAWCKTVQKTDRYVKDAKSITIQRSSAQYRTLWFQHGGNTQAIPALRQGVVPARSSVLLVIRGADGVVHKLRLECGFQPFQARFPGVPPLSVSHTTVRHHVTPHVPAHPSSPSTSHNCHCISKARASQAPLPAPQQTQSVPSTQPSAQPTQPANPSSPPPPKQGGANGGSKHQPGQTAAPSPIPEMPSSSPTQNTNPGGF